MEKGEGCRGRGAHQCKNQVDPATAPDPVAPGARRRHHLGVVALLLGLLLGGAELAAIVPGGLLLGQSGAVRGGVEPLGLLEDAGLVCR